MIYAQLTSLEPIVNGEIPEYGINRPKGAPLRFNRRSIVYPEVEGTSVQYQLVKIPAINGNSVRGQTRRVFIYNTLQVLKTPQKSVHPEIIHFIATGGGTGKDDKAGQDQFKFKQEIRKKLPFVNLLGGSLRGMFLKGMLRVGFVYPIVEETRWMLANTPFKNEFETQMLLNASELEQKLDKVRLTRRKIDDDFLKYSETDNIPVEVEEESNDEPNRDKGAIYSAEALPAGLPMFTYFEIRRPNDELMDAALHAFVQSFMEMGTLGGYIAKGCGRMQMKFYYKDGKEFDLNRAQKYWDYLKEHKDEINKYMASGLTEYFKSADRAREKKKN